MRKNFVFLLFFILIAIGFYIYKTQYTPGHKPKTATSSDVYDEYSLAKDIRAQIDAEKFVEADQALAKFALAKQKNELGGDQFTSIVDFIITQDLYNSQFIDKLQRWISAVPNSPMPYIIRADLYAKLAAAYLPTNSLADLTTTPKNYSDYLTQANSDISIALQINADIPYLWHKQMIISRMANRSEEEKLNLFKQAAEKFPQMYELYSERLSQLTPDWGGSIEKMKEFTKQYRSQKILTFLPYDYYYMAIFHVCDNIPKCNITRKQGAMLDEAGNRADIINAIRSTAKTYPRIIERVTKDADRFIANKYLEPGFKLIILEQKAVGENYSTELTQAAYSLEAGRFDEAIEFLQKVSKSVENSKIRSADARHRLISMASFQLAFVYLGKRDYDTALKYANAAISEYDKDSNYFLLRSVVYYKLKQFDNANKDLLASFSPTERDTMPALFVRGKTDLMIERKFEILAKKLTHGLY